MKAMVKSFVKGLPYLNKLFVDRDRLRGECARLQGERDQFRGWCKQLKAERDQFDGWCGQLKAERDQFGGWCEQLKAERDHFQAALERSVIRPHLATVQPHEQELLQLLVEETSGCEGPIVEIGTLLGVTTTRLACWDAGGRKILTVDNFAWNPWGISQADHHALTRQVLAYLTHTGRVEQVVLGKAEFYASYRSPAPSLAFLDAIHTYEETKKDIEWARSAGTRVIAGHDYGPQFPGVIQAVDEAGGPRRLCGTVWCL